MIGARQDRSVGPRHPDVHRSDRQRIHPTLVGEAQPNRCSGSGYPYDLTDGDVDQVSCTGIDRHLAGIVDQPRRSGQGERRGGWAKWDHRPTGRKTRDWRRLARCGRRDDIAPCRHPVGVRLDRRGGERAALRRGGKRCSRSQQDAEHRGNRPNHGKPLPCRFCFLLARQQQQASVSNRRLLRRWWNRVVPTRAVNSVRSRFGARLRPARAPPM